MPKVSFTIKPGVCCDNMPFGQRLVTAPRPVYAGPIMAMDAAPAKPEGKQMSETKSGATTDDHYRALMWLGQKSPELLRGYINALSGSDLGEDEPRPFNGMPRTTGTPIESSASLTASGGGVKLAGDRRPVRRDRNGYPIARVPTAGEAKGFAARFPRAGDVRVEY